MENSWPKSITVDKRIVRILSGSTYANFPSAIREIVTNSYDADAELVSINVDLEKEIITVLDNGKGMNETDFSFYLRIAGKTRKKEEKTTKGNRRVIGQFGVGFLSALPFCEKYLIETTKKGSLEVLSATINCKEYLTDDNKKIDVDRIPIEGKIKEDKSKRDEHYTKIRLVGFSKLSKSFFSGEYNNTTKRNTVINYKPIDLFKWELCEYLPIKYKGANKIEGKLNKLSEGFTQTPFHVTLDGEDLYRNIYAENLLEISDKMERIGNIRFKYAILTNYETISPIEGRYWMLRNLNMGVGERTTFGLGLEGKVYAKLAHLTGEVIIYEGLNELISVSRDKFNFSPDYESLKTFLSKKLSALANELDAIKGIEKISAELDNKSEITKIQNLSVDNINKEIVNLQSKGYKVTKSSSPASQNLKTVSLNKKTKEVIVSSAIDNYHKTITVSDKDYKLQLSKWEQDDYNPAIKEENGLILVNESYKLFQEKKFFNTFLKLHIILLKHVLSEKIDLDTYKLIQQDIIKTFEHNHHD